MRGRGGCRYVDAVCGDGVAGGGIVIGKIGNILWYNSIVVVVDLISSLVIVAAGGIGGGEVVVWADCTVTADGNVCLVIERVVVAVCDGDIQSVRASWVAPASISASAYDAIAMLRFTEKIRFTNPVRAAARGYICFWITRIIV